MKPSIRLYSPDRSKGIVTGDSVANDHQGELRIYPSIESEPAHVFMHKRLLLFERFLMSAVVFFQSVCFDHWPGESRLQYGEPHVCSTKKTTNPSFFNIAEGGASSDVSLSLQCGLNLSVFNPRN